MGRKVQVFQCVQDDRKKECCIPVHQWGCIITMGSGIFLGRYRTQNAIIASSQIMSYWLTKKDNILKIVYSMKQENHIFSVNLVTLEQQLVEIKIYLSNIVKNSPTSLPTTLVKEIRVVFWGRLPSCTIVSHCCPNSKIKSVYRLHPKYLGIQTSQLCMVYLGKSSWMRPQSNNI